MDDVLSNLQPIFRDVFDDKKLVIVPESNAQSIDGWDSLAHINLVSAVEKEFQVRFALGELQELKNVGDMIVLIKHKIGLAKRKAG